MTQTWPKLVSLNPISYYIHFARLGKNEVGLKSNGYGQFWTNPQVVYLRVFPLLTKMTWYREYLQRVLAHEFWHCRVKNSDHEPDGDMMAPSIMNAKTDKHHVMAESAEWRAAVTKNLF